MHAWIGAMLIALVVGLGSGAAARADVMREIELICPNASDANLARLCVALRDRLTQRAEALNDHHADVVIALQGRSLSPSGLVAQLIVTRSGRRFASVELTLTVTDRADIPAAALDRFAGDLIASAALAGY